MVCVIKGNITTGDSVFYTNCDPHNPLSGLVRQNNRNIIHLYDQLHDVELEDDMDTHMAQVAALLGTSKSQAGHTFVIKYILDRIPSFKSLALEIGHLDKNHLTAVAETLFKAKDEFFPELEEQLISFLTPTKQNQGLPSTRKIKNRLREWLIDLDPEWGAEPPKSEEYLAFKHDHDTTRIEGEYALSAGKELHEAVRAVAERDGITMPEALLNLVLGRTIAHVTLNLYTTQDGTYLEGVGKLNAQQERQWLDRVTKRRDLSNAKWERTANYRPTERIRAYVEGRDGCCRFPNCTVPAQKCDLDHVVPFPEGPTTPTNLQCLCRHHHNMKTDGRMDCRMDEKGLVSWIFPDGTEIVEEPTGPWAEKSPRWGRTFRNWLDGRAA